MLLKKKTGKNSNRTQTFCLHRIDIWESLDKNQKVQLSYTFKDKFKFTS